ncbi:MAG: PilN domain-containing protein [Deltaproteobacteria bacterium]|nr:PilN domain-containing protein [Deltaproteobacteria bacterium]MBW2122127.1 PilN domain-containing protein [Deltaproteobacteria bacterium]
MIRINLLVAREERKRESIRKEATIFVVVIALVLAGVGLIQWFSDRQRDEIITQIRNSRAELKRLEAIKREINKAKANKKMLQEKLDIIVRLNKNRTRPIEIMTLLASKIPKKMWLKSLDKKAQKLTLQGIALDDETIANFMKSLQQSKMFTAVQLVVTERVTVEKINLKKFTMICTIGA